MVVRPKSITEILGHTYIKEATKNKWKHRKSCPRGKPHYFNVVPRVEGPRLGPRRRGYQKGEVGGET